MTTSLADKIRNGEELSENERHFIANIVGLVANGLYEKTGGPFICGTSGNKDQSGLPESLLVCPAFGLSGFAVYTKTIDYSEPGY